MNKIDCQQCHCQIDLGAGYRKPQESKHHILCNDCLKSHQTCSIQQCREDFLLDDTDLLHLRTVYNGNPKNKNQLFVFSDIVDIINTKYGGIDKLEKAKRAKVKYLKVQQQMECRKSLLMDILDSNKLEYKSYGDCYSYVKYGTPSIETVVTNELNKLQIKRRRIITLAQQLSSLNIPFDENLAPCYNYINNIGCKSLPDIINELEQSKPNNQPKTHKPNPFVVRFD